MTLPQVPLPVAGLLAIITAAAGAWMTAQRTQAELLVRMTGAEASIVHIESQLSGYTPNSEFQLALADIKRELDDIRGDVKEIRRQTGR